MKRIAYLHGFIMGVLNRPIWSGVMRYYEPTLKEYFLRGWFIGAGLTD